MKANKRLTIKEKCTMVDEFESGQCKSLIAKKFNLSITAVTKILNNKEKYKNASLQENMKKRHRVDEGQNAMMEKALVEWIKHKRSLGIPLSGSIIREKAKWFHEELIKLDKQAKVILCLENMSKMDLILFKCEI